MIDVRYLLKFLDAGVVLRRLFILIFLAVFPVFDLWLLFYLNTHMDFYLLLAIISGVSLTGFCIAIPVLLKALKNIKNRIRYGAYPASEFNYFAGVLISAILMIFPGFISFVVGLIFLLPPLGKLGGRIITGRLDRDLKEVYEYIKLYEVDV